MFTKYQADIEIVAHISNLKKKGNSKLPVTRNSLWEQSAKMRIKPNGMERGPLSINVLDK